MTRILVLILIGGATFLVLWFLNNPSAFDDVWLYAVGLSGVIMKFTKAGFEKLKKLFEEIKK